MANKQLFSSSPGKMVPVTDTVNEAGGRAYALSAQHQLAQYATTGCLSNTYYTSAEVQLENILKLTQEVDPAFIAKAAIYGRRLGYMKDVPALLVASLTSRKDGMKYFPRAFREVIDNGKMLRNFVQIMRSGAVGRKSLGTRPRNLVREWLAKANGYRLLDATVGNDPSLADVVKMVHPKPADDSRKAFYAWLIGKEYNEEMLPIELRLFEQFKRKETTKIPNVPFQMLTALDLTSEQWAEIAKNSGWHMVRMNLNTFLRHKVFDIPEMAEIIATRLVDKEAIAKSKVFPYQLLGAFLNVNDDVPQVVKLALQDALDISLANVPQYGGNVVVCPDVSGSMSSSVTGSHGKVTPSKMRCVDVAALVAATVLRQNSLARVLPFATRVVNISLNPRDSVMTNARKLASVGGGGTACSTPLALLNNNKHPVDLVIYISDNQSWIDYQTTRGTAMMSEWQTLKSRNPQAKIVCIDIQPYTSSQMQADGDTLFVGGFSDRVFDIVNLFAKNELNGNHWVDVIDKVSLEE